MAPQASKKCGLLPTDHQCIGSYTSNGINSEQVPVWAHARFETVRQVVKGIAGIILVFLASASLSACVEVNVGTVGGDEDFEPPDYIFTKEEIPKSGAECSLSGLVNRRQNTDVWCWAASSQMVMEYLNASAGSQLSPLF